MNNYVVHCKTVLYVLAFLFTIKASATADKIIAVGDIEGQGHRLYHVLDHSGAFTKTSNGYVLKPGFKFVFTGDSIDRGPDNIKVLSTLIQLKQTHPDHVFLLMGNRDLNKFYLLKLFEKEIQAGLSPNPFTATHLQTLKTYFHRIGADDALDFYKQELELMQGQPVSETEALTNYMKMLQPNGLLWKFISLSQVAYHDKDTKGLFVHGAITEQNLGRVPGQQQKIQDIDLWVNTLNHWAQNNFEDLLTYMRPLPETPGRNDTGVITGRFSDSFGTPVFPNQNVQNELKKNDIQYVAVGHTPYADVPMILSENNLKVLLMDTSASAYETKTLITISEKEIIATGLYNKAEKYDLKIKMGSSHQPEGHYSSTGWLTLGKLSTGNHLEWKAGPHYTALYQTQSLKCQSALHLEN